MPTDFLTVLSEFQERDIRYVLVGGLAVLLHGVDRLTADIDLVVDLAPGARTMAKGIRYVSAEFLGSAKSTPNGGSVRPISYGL